MSNMKNFLTVNTIGAENSISKEVVEAHCKIKYVKLVLEMVNRTPPFIVGVG